MKTKSNTQLNKIPLFDSKGKKQETLELNKAAFTGAFNEDLLYQSIVMYRANMRHGTASTKTRGNVRGSGKKPWRQKGTGRARVGSKRTPVWRSGGVVFGPHPRDFSYSLPKKMKRSAFISSLNAKLSGGKVSGLDKESPETPKTKVFSDLLKKMNIKEKSVLFLASKIDNNLSLATRNIKRFSLKKVNEATALDVLSHDHVIITKEAAGALNERVSK